MKKLVSDSVLNLKPYIPGKPIEELEREYGIKNSCKLASNENCAGASPLAIEAIKKELKNIYFYPESSCFYLKQKLANKFNFSLTKIIIGNGSNEIIELLVKTFVFPEEEILTFEKSFLIYKTVAQGANRKIIEAPLVHGFEYDLCEILKYVSSKTKLIFIANPNNPTGVIFKRVDFENFISKLPEDIILAIDEAYFEYVDDSQYPNSLLYHDKFKNLVTMRTFSKIYGLAGIRVGYGFANEIIVEYLNRVRQPFNINSLAQVAA
jgi:histidinol-phosphate aminotransferase